MPSRARSAPVPAQVLELWGLVAGQVERSLATELAQVPLALSAAALA
jgi:hypothetical protein